MQRPFELGRVAGIPIFLDPSWFVILALVTWTLGARVFPSQLSGLPPPAYWGMGLASALLLFTCVLLHELSHALVARAFGTPVNRITLFIFGGVAQLGRESRRPMVELLVALAGPAASGVLAAGGWWGAGILAAQLPSLTATGPVQAAGLIGLVILKYLAMVNVAVIAFNLLPGFPLDGGRVLRALLWAWLKDWSKATKIASTLGSGLAVALWALGVTAIVRGRWVGGMWYVLLGVFLWDAARASFQAALASTSK